MHFFLKRNQGFLFKSRSVQLSLVIPFDLLPLLLLFPFTLLQFAIVDQFSLLPRLRCAILEQEQRPAYYSRNGRANNEADNLAGQVLGVQWACSITQ